MAESQNGWQCFDVVNSRPVFRGGEGLRGLNPPPPQKSLHKNVMNIIMAVIGLFGLKRAPECIKMHHFEGENANFFLGKGHTFLDTGLVNPEIY